MKENETRRDITYHEPVPNGGAVFMAGFILASLGAVLFGGIAIIENPQILKNSPVPILEKMASWKQEEKDSRHIDNLELVEHWGTGGKVRVFKDKSGNVVPMDAIIRTPKEPEINDEDRASLTKLLGGL
jgi:hypothetical protein